MTQPTFENSFTFLKMYYSWKHIFSVIVVQKLLQVCSSIPALEPSPDSKPDRGKHSTAAVHTPFLPLISKPNTAHKSLDILRQQGVASRIVPGGTLLFFKNGNNLGSVKIGRPLEHTSFTAKIARFSLFRSPNRVRYKSNTYQQVTGTHPRTSSSIPMHVKVNKEVGGRGKGYAINRKVTLMKLNYGLGNYLYKQKRGLGEFQLKSHFLHRHLTSTSAEFLLSRGIQRSARLQISQLFQPIAVPSTKWNMNKVEELYSKLSHTVYSSIESSITQVHPSIAIDGSVMKSKALHTELLGYGSSQMQPKVMRAKRNVLFQERNTISQVISKNTISGVEAKQPDSKGLFTSVLHLAPFNNSKMDSSLEIMNLSVASNRIDTLKTQSLLLSENVHKSNELGITSKLNLFTNRSIISSTEQSTGTHIRVTIAQSDSAASIDAILLASSQSVLSETNKYIKRSSLQSTYHKEMITERGKPIVETSQVPDSVHSTMAFTNTKIIPKGSSSLFTNTMDTNISDSNITVLPSSHGYQERTILNVSRLGSSIHATHTMSRLTSIIASNRKISKSRHMEDHTLSSTELKSSAGSLLRIQPVTDDLYSTVTRPLYSLSTVVSMHSKPIKEEGMSEKHTSRGSYLTIESSPTFRSQDVIQSTKPNSSLGSSSSQERDGSVHITNNHPETDIFRGKSSIASHQEISTSLHMEDHTLPSTELKSSTGSLVWIQSATDDIYITVTRPLYSLSTVESVLSKPLKGGMSERHTLRGSYLSIESSSTFGSQDAIQTAKANSTVVPSSNEKRDGSDHYPKNYPETDINRETLMSQIKPDLLKASDVLSKQVRTSTSDESSIVNLGSSNLHTPLGSDSLNSHLVPIIIRSTPSLKLGTSSASMKALSVNFNTYPTSLISDSLHSDVLISQPYATIARNKGRTTMQSYTNPSQSPIKITEAKSDTCKSTMIDTYWYYNLSFTSDKLFSSLKENQETSLPKTEIYITNSLYSSSTETTIADSESYLEYFTNLETIRSTLLYDSFKTLISTPSPTFLTPGTEYYGSSLKLSGQNENAFLSVTPTTYVYSQNSVNNYQYYTKPSSVRSQHMEEQWSFGMTNDLQEAFNTIGKYQSGYLQTLVNETNDSIERTRSISQNEMIFSSNMGSDRKQSTTVVETPTDDNLGMVVSSFNTYVYSALTTVTNDMSDVLSSIVAISMYDMQSIISSDTSAVIYKTSNITTPSLHAISVTSRDMLLTTSRDRTVLPVISRLSVKDSSETVSSMVSGPALPSYDITGLHFSSHLLTTLVSFAYSGDYGSHYTLDKGDVHPTKWMLSFTNDEYHHSRTKTNGLIRYTAQPYSFSHVALAPYSNYSGEQTRLSMSSNIHKTKSDEISVTKYENEQSHIQKGATPINSILGISATGSIKYSQQDTISMLSLGDDVLPRDPTIRTLLLASHYVGSKHETSTLDRGLSITSMHSSLSDVQTPPLITVASLLSSKDISPSEKYPNSKDNAVSSSSQVSSVTGYEISQSPVLKTSIQGKFDFLNVSSSQVFHSFNVEPKSNTSSRTTSTARGLSQLKEGSLSPLLSTIDERESASVMMDPKRHSSFYEYENAHKLTESPTSLPSVGQTEVSFRYDYFKTFSNIEYLQSTHATNMVPTDSSMKILSTIKGAWGTTYPSYHVKTSDLDVGFVEKSFHATRSGSLPAESTDEAITQSINVHMSLTVKNDQGTHLASHYTKQAVESILLTLATLPMTSSSINQNVMFTLPVFGSIQSVATDAFKSFESISARELPTVYVSTDISDSRISTEVPVTKTAVNINQSSIILKLFESSNIATTASQQISARIKISPSPSYLMSKGDLPSTVVIDGTKKFHTVHTASDTYSMVSILGSITAGFEIETTMSTNLGATKVNFLLTTTTSQSQMFSSFQRQQLSNSFGNVVTDIWKLSTRRNTDMDTTKVEDVHSSFLIENKRGHTKLSPSFHSYSTTSVYESLNSITNVFGNSRKVSNTVVYKTEDAGIVGLYSVTIEKGATISQSSMLENVHTYDQKYSIVNDRQVTTSFTALNLLSLYQTYSDLTTWNAKETTLNKVSTSKLHFTTAKNKKSSRDLFSRREIHSISKVGYILPTPASIFSKTQSAATERVSIFSWFNSNIFEAFTNISLTLTSYKIPSVKESSNLFTASIRKGGTISMTDAKPETTTTSTVQSATIKQGPPLTKISLYDSHNTFTMHQDTTSFNGIALQSSFPQNSKVVRNTMTEYSPVHKLYTMTFHHTTTESPTFISDVTSTGDNNVVSLSGDETIQPSYATVYHETQTSAKGDISIKETMSSVSVYSTTQYFTSDLSSSSKGIRMSEDKHIVPTSDKKVMSQSGEETIQPSYETIYHETQASATGYISVQESVSSASVISTPRYLTSDLPSSSEGISMSGNKHIVPTSASLYDELRVSAKQDSPTKASAISTSAYPASQGFDTSTVKAGGSPGMPGNFLLLILYLCCTILIPAMR